MLLLKELNPKLRTFKYFRPVCITKSTISCNTISTMQCNKQQQKKKTVILVKGVEQNNTNVSTNTE